MRRLVAGEVLAVAAGAGLAVADAFAFFSARQPVVGSSSDRACCCRQVSVTKGQRQEQQGGGDVQGVYGRDDQRRFWDTVSKVHSRVSHHVPVLPCLAFWARCPEAG